MCIGSLIRKISGCNAYNFTKGRTGYSGFALFFIIGNCSNSNKRFFVIGLGHIRIYMDDRIL